MYEFAKRMTMGFVVALLVAGLIGYGGMKRKVLPLYAEEVGQQSIGAVIIQDIRAFLGTIQSPTITADYYSDTYIPLPDAFGAIDGRPF